MGGAEADFVRKPPIGDELRHDLDAALHQRIAVALLAVLGEGHAGGTVDQADAAVAKLQQMLRRGARRVPVVDIEPGDWRADVGAAMQDEWQAQFVQEAGPFVHRRRRMQDDGVDAFALGKAAIGAQFMFVIFDVGERDVHLVVRQPLAHAAEELAYMRAELFCAAHDQADRTAAPGG